MSEKEFLEQVKSNQGIIYKLVSLYATDAEEKKDLYQEILLQCWKSWKTFRHESKFSTWLYRLALNTILTQKRKVSPVDFKDSLDHLQVSAKNETEINIGLSHLKWAIRQLPETDRAIISMHLDGYENAEIATVIGISNNHVAVKLHRSKQLLSNLLNKGR